MAIRCLHERAQRRIELASATRDENRADRVTGDDRQPRGPAAHGPLLGSIATRVGEGPA